MNSFKRSLLLYILNCSNFVINDVKRKTFNIEAFTCKNLVERIYQNTNAGEK